MPDDQNTHGGTIVRRWIDLLHRSATGSKKIRTLLTPVGIFVFGLFVTLFVAAANITDEMLGLPPLLQEGAAVAISIPLMAIGLVVTGWSAVHFLSVKGTPVPFNPPPKVVTTGPYRYVRNPMLSGVFLFLFGLGFLLASISLVFLFTPLFILANVWELKHIEEPELIRRLGDEYAAYRRRTPMFLPRV
jgi:protein-S-isoprenylcysteine O-methyltransferase Ste14